MLVSLFGEKTAQEELRRRGKCSLFHSRYTPQPNKTLKFKLIQFNKHFVKHLLLRSTMAGVYSFP